LGFHHAGVGSDVHENLAGPGAQHPDRREGLLSSIDFSKLTVFASGDDDTIEFDNSDDLTAYNYLIDDAGIYVGDVGLSYEGFESLRFRPGAAGGEVRVGGVPSKGATIIGGDGADKVTVASLLPTDALLDFREVRVNDELWIPLEDLKGNIFFDGGEGSDYTEVNGAKMTEAASFSLTSNSWPWPHIGGGQEP